jgi:hypothetical protein
MTTRVRVRTVQPLKDTLVRLELTNGEQRDVDLGPYLKGPIFQPISESNALFRQVGVDPELGTVVWPNGADIDPDVLLGGLQPAPRQDPRRRLAPPEKKSPAARTGLVTSLLLPPR